MDKPHIEKEYKMMINEDVYNSLLNQLGVKPFRQVNYYYDVFNNECAVRIREVDNKHIFTLKTRGDGFKYEYEFEIKEKNFDDEKVQEVFKKFKITEYKYLGEMTTDRAIYKLTKGEICLDKSMYFDKTDYEIEYELFDYLDDGFKEFEELLKNNNLSYTKSPKSKYKRFLDELIKKDER